MMYGLVFLIVYLGFYLLFLLSEKRKKQTLTSKFKVVLQYPRLFKIFAYFLFILAISILISLQSGSVGFVSFWVFASPIIFLLVLSHSSFKLHKK